MEKEFILVEVTLIKKPNILESMQYKNIRKEDRRNRQPIDGENNIFTNNLLEYPILFDSDFVIKLI